MKPVFESIPTRHSGKSLIVFELEEVVFEPFWHYHPEYELTFILEGSGIRFVGDSVSHYEKGDLVLLGPNLPHQWTSKESAPGQMQRALVIQFQENLFNAIPELKDVARFLSSSSFGLQFSEVKASMKKMVQEMPALEPALQISRLIELLSSLKDHPNKHVLSQTTKFTVSGDGKEQKRINQTIAYVVANVGEPLSVGMMANRCNMVPQSFCRWFKRHTGLSFVGFLNKTRVQVACQYLLNTDLHIQQVAFKAGYENTSHFNRTFKKIMGHSPTAFKKRHGR